MLTDKKAEYRRFAVKNRLSLFERGGGYSLF